MKIIINLKIRILKLLKKNRRYFSIGKIKMFLDYLDPIDREIIEHQKYEDQEINFLIKNIKENDINYFIDVGSNFGYYSITLAYYNKNLKIKAFESNEEAYNKFFYKFIKVIQSYV